MRTELTRKIGSVSLEASVTAGALMDINERYGDAHDLSRIIDRQHAKKAMEIVAICIAAKGGKGATDALEDVKRAVEEGGATAVINFMAELIAHAYGKTVAVSGETAPDQ